MSSFYTVRVSLWLHLRRILTLRPESWLSIPLPVWDSTLNEFEWEALGILTDWSHPNVLRVYICNATGSMRQELWEAVQDIKCEEYLDPHLLHPTILQIVYMKWWAAMAVVEDLAAARTVGR